ncbi:MAG: 6-bladed beta-propeller [Gemmatimonadaceae bacterium]
MILGASSLALGAQASRRLVVETRTDLDEGPREPIGDLRDFAVGTDGRVYVLDGRLQLIHLFRPDGTFERTISREGSGPGELRRANGLLIAPDSTLWAHDHGNNRISVFAPDGSFLRQHRQEARSYGYRWDGVFDNERRLVTRVFSGMGPTGSYALQRTALDGRVLDTLSIPGEPVQPSGPAPFYQAEFPNKSRRVSSYPFREPVAPAFDARGFWWQSSDPNTFRLTKTSLTGVTVATATRNVPAERIPSALRDSAIKRIEASIKGATRHDVDFARVPTTFSHVRQLVVDDGGWVWARRGSADSVHTTFDVFEGRGQFTFSVLVAERLSSYGRLIVRGDVLYAVALDQDDLPTIVKARLIPGR